MEESCLTAMVFVNYRDYSHLQNLLELQQSVPSNCRIVVVDNTEEEYRDLKALERIRNTSGVTLLLAGNLGYLGAVRYAMEAVPGIGEAAFLLVCNTDLRFDFADTVGRLCASRDRLSSLKVGIVAPRLVLAEGSQTRQMHLIRVPSARRMKRLAMLFSNRLVLGIYKRAGDVKRNSLARRYEAQPDLSDGERVFAPHGSLMIFTSDYLRTDAPFAFPCFLFGEEVFVGLHAERNGLSCVYEESLPYSHEAHGSMGRWPSRAVSTYLRDSHRWAAKALAEREAGRS